MNPKFTTLQELWNHLQKEARKKVKDRAKSNPSQTDGGGVNARR